MSTYRRLCRAILATALADREDPLYKDEVEEWLQGDDCKLIMELAGFAELPDYIYEGE